MYCPTCGNQYAGWATLVSQSCPYGHEGLICNTSCNLPKQVINGHCIIPEPYLKQKGPSDSCPSTQADNPINFAIGNKFQLETDYQPSGNTTLSFCPNSNSTFTYDNRGLLKTKLDKKGNLTTYDYNERDLEISRTEAAGTPQARTITTEWHPTLFLPVSITEPNQITSYTYNTQG
ncbi:RHS repeat protein [Pseudomonas sp. TTU2014-080ASC]|uniref:RHS repeat protein n=1 Tax=Pseudomonas sp. TTU2014-080ASC TaxID=1729724 RepID=UPI000A6316EB|nr:RHS repeat protein [Pseudomonas sp. TTU2014-080ASC]